MFASVCIVLKPIGFEVCWVTLYSLVCVTMKQCFHILDVCIFAVVFGLMAAISVGMVVMGEFFNDCCTQIFYFDHMVWVEGDVQIYIKSNLPQWSINLE